MFPQEVLDGFEEETGCKIVYSNFDTDETMLEKVSMAKGGDYDVVIADDYILEKIVEEGLATKLDKDKISNWGNINPLYQGQFYDEKDEYTVPYGAGIPLIVYDPEEVDLDIKGYSDLWDPSLEDSIALIGNYRVINGITLLTMGKSMNEEDVDTMAEAGEKADVVFMDPPRSGSSEKFLNSVIKLSPKKIVYISCNPETLARDLNFLTRKNYIVREIQPVEMFCFTDHTEVVTWLEQK